jgi:hypothetical protein
MADTELKRILSEALWIAYCDGRAGNEYIPQEVVPGLIKEIQQIHPQASEDGLLTDSERSEVIQEEAGYRKLEGEPPLLSEKEILEAMDRKPFGCIRHISLNKEYLEELREITKAQDIKTASVKDKECQERAEGILNMIIEDFVERTANLHMSDGDHRITSELWRNLKQALKEKTLSVSIKQEGDDV